MWCAYTCYVHASESIMLFKPSLKPEINRNSADLIGMPLRSPALTKQVCPFAATLMMKKFTQKCLPWPCDVHTCHTQHLQMHLSNIFHSRMHKIRPPFRFDRLPPLPLICGGARRSALAPDENRFGKRRRAPHSLRGKRCRAARFPRGAGRPRSQRF